MNIGFIGLGKLGMPSAEVFAEKNMVYGYDIIPKSNANIRICASIKEVAENAEIIFIAIQTPHHKDYGGEIPASQLPKMNFDYSFLESVMAELNTAVSDNQLVVVISTVLPGTIRKRIHPLLSRGKLIYNPYLIAMGTVQEDLKNPEMLIVGTEDGIEDEHFQKLITLYKNTIGHNFRIEYGTWEEAESIKIFYNTFISMKIAVVNMIQDVAEEIGNMNVDVVTEALANSTKRIISKSYMKAGMGDGGPCHPRDNIALSWLAQDLHLPYDIFTSITESREQQAKRLAQKLVSYNNPVVILGISYKPNVSLTDGSYGLLVASYLKDLGCDVFYDRHTNDEIKYTYLIAHENVYNEYPFTADSVVVDVWRSFKTNRSDIQVVHYGNTRKIS